jgi:hypothetical protein
MAALTAGIAYRGLTRCAVRWVVRLHCVAGWGGFGFSWRFMRFLLLVGPAAAQRTTVATHGAIGSPAEIEAANPVSDKTETALAIQAQAQVYSRQGGGRRSLSGAR